jgi:hypothetical protein
VDPTSLPTDNLYKFLALSGLALAAFCTWSCQKAWATVHNAADAFRLKAVESKGRHSLMRTFADPVAESAAELARRAEALDASYEKGDHDEHGLETEVEALNSEIADAVSVLSAGTKLTSELATKLEVLDKRVELTFGRVSSQVWFYKAGIVAGLAVSACGFALWYVKLQAHLDQMTIDNGIESKAAKAKADLAELELAKAHRGRRHR